MNKSAWIKLFPAAVLCAAFLPVQTGWGQQKQKSAYEELDQSRLAERLRAFGMNELLESLVRSGKSADTKSIAILVQARISAAVKARDQAESDKLLDGAIVLLDKLIKATAGAEDDQAKLQHYRFMLDRIVVEGTTRTAPYIERLSYFQARPGDGETVARLTQSAITLLGRLIAKLETLHEKWAGDDERMVTGVLWRLEEFIQEVRYRGAWIRMYRAMAIPPDSDERAMHLKQAITNVAEFAGAEDNSSGAKFYSLLLSGMCARMMGEWHNASGFLQSAADRNASAGIRLRAYFETVVCLIDQKKFAEAQKAVDNFIRQSGTLPVQKVVADFHAILLKNRLLEVQAEDVKKEDPARSAKLLEESRKILLDFVEKYPAYRDQIMEIVVGKYDRTDTKDIPPGIRVLIGVREFTRAVRKVSEAKKETPDFTRAEEIFAEVLVDKRSGDSAQATALWHMGHIRSIQQSNIKAARYFSQLADKFPAETRTKDAALLAVKSFQGVLEEKKPSPDALALAEWNEFVRQYAHCLEVLVKARDDNAPDIHTYHYYYELGTMYDILGRNDEALAALNKIDPDSELYLPSRSRILSLRAEILFDSAAGQETRQRLAVDLVRDLYSYCRRARAYADKTTDKQRKQQVLGWGANCDMVLAQILKDVLNQPAQSIAHAEKATRDWPEITDLDRRSREFIIRVLLESGQTTDAVEKLLKLVEQKPKGAEGLITKAIDQIHVRILRLEFRPDAKSRKKLAELRKAYRVFAEKLHTWARQSKMPANQMYGYEQALAIAYASSDNIEDVKKARDMFERLDREKPNQAMNVLGLARCLGRLEKNTDAMKQYDRLTTGLPSKSAQWWRAQLERLQFALQIYGENADGLESIRLQVRVLRHKDSKMGEYWKLFNAVDNNAGELLKTIESKSSK
ncbi:MAG: hypothetical protein K8R91_00185 [Phycisphaerae bacterium]|nr:hypothetical protein [Phycisphaerae bacterium]